MCTWKLALEALQLLRIGVQRPVGGVRRQYTREVARARSDVEDCLTRRGAEHVFQPPRGHVAQGHHLQQVVDPWVVGGPSSLPVRPIDCFHAGSVRCEFLETKPPN